MSLNDFNWYLKAAEQGNAEAQYNVALCYYLGDGVEEDKRTAFNWFLKAAEQGDAEAQCYVGYYYDEGKGGAVEENKKIAFEWYLKAAEQDNALAQSLVAGLYALGEGTEKNKTEAFNWGLKAAEHGDAEMQCIIAYSYALGEGVKQNKTEAFKWFLKAAKQGDTDAQIKVKTYRCRIIIAFILIIVYCLLLFLTYRFGWDTMEKYTYFFGLACLYFTFFYSIIYGEKWDFTRYFKEEYIRKSLETKNKLADTSKSQNELRKK